MSIGIQGIKVGSLSLSKGGEGKAKVQGEYELISTTDKVLATQGFNSYGGMEISWSPATHQAIDALLAAIKADISATIGI